MSADKVIFLDIDGVLNSFTELRKEIDPRCVAALNALTDATGAEIVISSNLRREGLRKMQRRLRSWGVRARVIGITPILSDDNDDDVERGDEIAAWLRENQEVRSFVVLDDNSDMGALMPWLVQIDEVFGLTMDDAEEAGHRLFADVSRRE